MGDTSDTADLGARLVAHRGWPRHYPENSLAGIEAALAAGARWLEFDLQFTADDVPVLAHDVDLRRVGDAGTRITGSRYDQLAGLTAGEPARFGSRFRETRIPRLAEAVARLADSPAEALVEVKPEALETRAPEAVLDTLLPLLAPLAGRWRLISYHAGLLERARDSSSASIGWIVPDYDDGSQRRAHRLCPDLLVCNARKLPEPPWWPGDWRWVVYTVNDAAGARRWLDRGAWLVETDDIGGLLGAPP